MGKTINDDLIYFETAYREKYNYCNNALQINEFTQAFINESNIEGYTNAQEYANYVIARFETGVNKRNDLLQRVETFRKKILTDVENNNIVKACERLETVKTNTPSIFVETIQIALNL